MSAIKPVAYLVEGWHDNKLIAHIPHLSADDAKTSAAVFARHYTTTVTDGLYRLTPAQLATLEQAEKLRELLTRYRNETPLGHQPHMIAHEVDAMLAAAPKPEAQEAPAIDYPTTIDSLRNTIKAMERDLDHAVEQAARNADEVLALREERDQLRTYFDAAQRRGEELRAENERLREALELAYGHLWLVNDEPGTPIRLHSSGSAASAARKILRDLITAEQRERGINAARAALAARAAQGEKP